MNSPRQHTVTALKRWSCTDKQLPLAQQVKNIHVYDFDNTLFLSPLPNKQVWNTSTFGQLQAQEFLVDGGWWHNPAILAATGQGEAVEETRAWEGCWNEKIVDLVRLSTTSEDTVSVLLTGRQEKAFGELIGKMVSSKGLQFDIQALRPTVGPNGEHFPSTMMFKQAFLKELIYTYGNAQEIRVYEDRPKHTKGFRDYFADLNGELLSSASAPRQPITAEVIQVSEQDSFMDPVAEVSEIQRMINTHNAAVLSGKAPPLSVPYKIKRSVFYTGYIISPSDSERLKLLVKLPAHGGPDHELRFLANNILITPRPAPRSILTKVGGIGAKLTWRVTGIACYQDRVWAARVAPIPSNATVYTENYTPCVVLATRRQAKPIEASRIQNWQPVPPAEAFEFETIVGEKVLLRIEEEVRGEDDYEASFPNAKNAKKHPREEDFPPLGAGKGPQKTNQRNNGPKPQHKGQQPQNGFNHGGNSAWQHNKPDGPGASRGGGIGFAAQRGGHHQGGRGAGAGRGGQRNFSGQKRGGHHQGGGGGGGRGKGRGGYKSLDDQSGQGYGGAGAMQY